MELPRERADDCQLDAVNKYIDEEGGAVDDEPVGVPPCV